MSTFDSLPGVDLHIHTNVAGGRWDLTELAHHVAQAGIRVIAITDHDTVVNVREMARIAEPLGVKVVPGVELTTGFDGILWHVLLYNVQTDDPDLRRLLEKALDLEDANAAKLSQELRNAGYDLTWLDTVAGRRSLTDVAISLARDGYARGMFDGFRIISQFPMSYSLVGLSEATAVAHRQGALAILAHPGRAVEGILHVADPDRIERMAAAGLDGIEAFYPSHTAEQRDAYAALANRLGLLTSCGSDSHGMNLPTSPIGWPPDLCQALLRRLGIQLLSSAPATVSTLESNNDDPTRDSDAN